MCVRDHLLNQEGGGGAQNICPKGGSVTTYLDRAVVFPNSAIHFNADARTPLLCMLADKLYRPFAAVTFNSNAFANVPFLECYGRGSRRRRCFQCFIISMLLAILYFRRLCCFAVRMLACMHGASFLAAHRLVLARAGRRGLNASFCRRLCPLLLILLGCALLGSRHALLGKGDLARNSKNPMLVFALEVGMSLFILEGWGGNKRR